MFFIRNLFNTILFNTILFDPILFNHRFFIPTDYIKNIENKKKTKKPLLIIDTYMINDSTNKYIKYNIPFYPKIIGDIEFHSKFMKKILDDFHSESNIVINKNKVYIQFFKKNGCMLFFCYLGLLASFHFHN